MDATGASLVSMSVQHKNKCLCISSSDCSLIHNKAEYFNVISEGLVSRGPKRVRDTEQFTWLCHGRTL